MLKALAIAALLLTGGPVDDAVTTERMERMLDEGDTALIVQTFRRHPGTVLPFIDGYLEGGLKKIEDGTPEASTRDGFRRGLAFAELATEAFGDRIFVEYAASFGSWSPQEQRNFRKGQEEYGLGRRLPDKPREARVHFQTSFDLASRLNDSWGMAMAAAGLARVARQLDDQRAAERYGAKATELYGRLRLTGGEADALVEYAHLLKDSQALHSLRRAWTLVEHHPGNEKRYRRVLDAYCSALERSGERDLAVSVRQRAEAALAEAGAAKD